MAQNSPLHGVQVLELATFVAGPYCSMTLAQLGADVTRVDAIGGGPDLHRWPLAPSGTSLYWTGLNRGKRSVTLDLGSEEGRGLVRELLGQTGDPGSGIVVTNASGRKWLEYAALSEQREDLIQVHVRGTADGRPALDYTVNPEVGLPHATGRDPLNEPTNHVLPAWDLLTGLHAALAVVSAVRHREVTGEGQLVEVSLEDVAFSATAALGMLAEPVVTGRERAPSGNHLYGAFGVDFPTGDGRRVMVVALTARQWRDLKQATGTAGVLQAVETELGVDFDVDGERYEHRDLIRSLLAPWFAARAVEEVTAAFAGTAVLTGRYRTFGEAVEHGRATGSLVEVQQPGIGPVPVGRQPLRYSSLPTRDAQPAPVLGADTEVVLTERLGREPAEIADLRGRGVIA